MTVDETTRKSINPTLINSVPSIYMGLLTSPLIKHLSSYALIAFGHCFHCYQVGGIYMIAISTSVPSVTYLSFICLSVEYLRGSQVLLCHHPGSVVAPGT